MGCAGPALPTWSAGQARQVGYTGTGLRQREFRREHRILRSSRVVARSLTTLDRRRWGDDDGFCYLPLAGSGQLTTITGREVSGLIHAHGALFSLWVLLFVMQTSLIAAHRVRVHQRMGIAGAVLAAAMIVAGVTLSISGAAAGVAPPGVSALSFLAIPLGDMVMFAGFIAAALWNRRDRETHKRLMLLAYISLLAAPMARLPGVLPLGPFAFYGLALVFLAICVVYDLVMRQRVHRTYVWGGGLLALSVPGRLMLSETAAWQAFARLLTQ